VDQDEDHFAGHAIDLTRWNVHAPNYGSKQMHFSKDNVLVQDGRMILHFEKKRGHHNDDPQGYESDYATGWADTYGKWVQRYGYFEARMKLPTAPSIFPAFWLMPDRGAAAGPQWKRGDTGHGGMEADILENLTIWGPYRYSIAMHWDGYQKNHKTFACANNYIQPDKEGFITVGLLWTPGSAVFYANGRETARWESPRVCSVPSYIIFDNNIGGWEKEPMDDARLPADLAVDYVRVWQRKDLASRADGPIPNTGPLGMQEE
jgi:beta-glucanase (GH16 family)